MNALLVMLSLVAAPVHHPKAPAGLFGAWYDHGTLFLVLRTDGTGQLGANLITWDVTGSTLDLTTADDVQHVPFVVKNKGKLLELTLPSTKIELDKGKLPPLPKKEPEKKPDEKKGKKPAAKTP